MHFPHSLDSYSDIHRNTTSWIIQFTYELVNPVADDPFEVFDPWKDGPTKQRPKADLDFVSYRVCDSTRACKAILGQKDRLLPDDTCPFFFDSHSPHQTSPPRHILLTAQLIHHSTLPSACDSVLDLQILLLRYFFYQLYERNIMHVRTNGNCAALLF